ncbi:MAG: helix-turn-helix domain-containing protein [Desulfobacterota bacterium]|nr:helix-turn-helix domain-containing protein [Thermodesulfobacteriota bacterium]
MAKHKNGISPQGDVFTTEEACHYLRISRPTLLKYLSCGRIKGAKAGKGWKVLRTELDRFLRGDTSESGRR